MSGERHGHGHGHGQVSRRPGTAVRWSIVLAISATILVVEVVGAVISGSAWRCWPTPGTCSPTSPGCRWRCVAAVLARRPATEARTWGYRRAEVLAAAAQAAVLLAVGGFVLVEAIRRLIEPPEVAAGAMVVFGVVGLVGNAGRSTVLAGGRGRQPEHPGGAPGGHQRRPRLGRRAGRRRGHRADRVATARTRSPRC